MLSADTRKALAHKWPLRIRNSQGTVIPPGAVMRIVSSAAVDGELVYTCAKPNSTAQNRCLVNGPFAIGIGSSDEGIGTTLCEAGYVLYDTGTPAVNEEWGPSSGSWTLTNAGTGFTIAGGITTLAGNAAVSAVQGIPAAASTVDGFISASGTLNAYADPLLSNSAGMSSLASQGIKGPGLSSSNMLMQTAIETATVYNPTPWQYLVDDILQVFKSNGIWLVDRSKSWTPHASVISDSGTDIQSDDIMVWDSISSNKGNVVSLAGSNKQVVIEAPVASRPFLVSCDMSFTSPDTGFTATYFAVGMRIGSNGSFSFGSEAFMEFDMRTTSLLDVSPYERFGFSLSYQKVVTLSENDYIQVKIGSSLSGSDNVTAIGSLTVTPLF